MQHVVRVMGSPALVENCREIFAKTAYEKDDYKKVYEQLADAILKAEAEEEPFSLREFMEKIGSVDWHFDVHIHIKPPPTISFDQVMADLLESRREHVGRVRRVELERAMTEAGSLVHLRGVCTLVIGALAKQWDISLDEGLRGAWAGLTS